MPKNVLIMGAAGKDFHVFNTTYRGKSEYRVVAFTATQIPNISGRVYPAVLAGKEYPKGIPIKPESELLKLIADLKVDEVVFAYSDVTYDYIKEREEIVRSAGANFKTFDLEPTLIPSRKKVVAVTAVRTGAGKSPASRRVREVLVKKGRKAAVIRHPMPYGDLSKQIVQRFAALEDMKKHKCTIEEMEEYEPHIMSGGVVFAGVDYGAILAEAEKEADVILWDGGNNDTPFYRPDVWMTIVDPLRPGHELTYFPGRINFEKADVLVISKCDQARKHDLEIVMENIQKYNPRAKVVKAAGPISVDDPSMIKGKRVLVVEDGPTLTHGGMKFGAGVIAARKFGAAAMVDPRPYLVGEIAEMFKSYPGIGTLLPALGYGEKQVADLEATINATDADAVVIATPIDLARIVKINKPTVRVSYELKEIEGPSFEEILKNF
jgi:predicted GTPase